MRDCGCDEADTCSAGTFFFFFSSYVGLYRLAIFGVFVGEFWISKKTFREMAGVFGTFCETQNGLGRFLLFCVLY